MGEIRLVDFDETDCAQLTRWVNDEGERLFWQWGGGAVFRFPLDDAQLYAHIQSARAKNPVRRVLKAVDDAGQMVGYLELNRIDYENRAALVSRVLVGRLTNRGKGFGHQMASALLDLAFAEMDIQTLALEVFDFNQGALRLYEKLGFTRDSQHQFRVLGEMWTSIRMSLNRRQW
ncbi:MAG TPA: GNAT family protein [Symbiobacteriaceae bacterium]